MQAEGGVCVCVHANVHACVLTQGIEASGTAQHTPSIGGVGEADHGDQKGGVQRARQQVRRPVTDEIEQQAVHLLPLVKNPAVAHAGQNRLVVKQRYDSGEKEIRRW